MGDYEDIKLAKAAGVAVTGSLFSEFPAAVFINGEAAR
jgi:hypothetical protein